MVYETGSQINLPLFLSWSSQVFVIVLENCPTQSVFVSQATITMCHKLGDLKQLFIVSVLDSRNPKSWCHQGHVSFKPCRWGMLYCLLQLAVFCQQFMVSLALRMPLSHLCLHQHIGCLLLMHLGVHMVLPVSFKDIREIELEATLMVSS
jgi:hypothetical protein